MTAGGTINNIYGYSEGVVLYLMAGFGITMTLGKNTGDAGASRIWNNTSTGIAFSTLEVAHLIYSGGIWRVVNGTNP